MADKSTNKMADPKAGETATDSKDLNVKAQQKGNKDVEFDADELASPDGKVREAAINKRVGPKVDGVNTRGAEFPIPEGNAPAVMPADQKPS